jgi:selenide,water dikinase
VLGQLETDAYPGDVVVAADTRDDAAVYRLPDGTGLVQTVDFFTPIVDDPFDWGRIAAANAFSDVYAMGGSPRLALNIVAWPIEELATELLADVLRGAAKVASEAGVAIVGGHSIHDPEPKYGMAVTGFVDLRRLTRNSTARPGGALILTKPLGVGVITTAIKRGKATPDQVAVAVETMTSLNAAAAEAMLEVGADAVTDITGYGLLGHLNGMLLSSGVAAEIDAAAVPLLSGALELAAADVVPAGTRANLAFVNQHVDWGELPEAERLLLADAQTSGGLLIAVQARRSEQLMEALEARGVRASRIGRITDGPAGRVTVRGRIRPR